MTERVAVITGAAKNMGSAFAQALGRQGCAVVIHHHGPSSRADAQMTADAVVSAGGRAILTEGDLANVDTVVDMFDRAIEAFGRVDIVINNAGLVIKKPLLDVTEEDFDRSFAINAKAAFFVMREAARRMSDNGRIVNMGTTILGATTPNYSVYAGSKAPLEDFTRALAKEVGARGITVNTVAPGPIDTSFYWGQEDEQSAARAASLGNGNRLGRIEDIVPVVEFLTSPSANWVTAQTIFVNGGFTAR